MHNLAIFASGSGSNAKNIINYFSNHSSVNVSCVVCNNPNAGVIRIAKDFNVPVIIITREEQSNPKQLINQLQSLNTSAIVLAGYLWLIPKDLIKAYEGRIINIHPALLPKFGGKGMYGSHVHNAVLNSGETETGITIHTIDEEYDKGEILFQAKCPVSKEDTEETLSQKVRSLEHQHFPKVIEKFMLSKPV